MEKTQKMPEIDSILIKPDNRDSVRVKVEELRLREVWRLYGNKSKPFNFNEAKKLSLAMFTEQQAKRQKAITTIEKEKQRGNLDRHSAERKCIANEPRLHFETVDENGILNEYGYNDKTCRIDKDKFDKIEHEINPKIGDIIESLIENCSLDNLPDPREDAKAFAQAFYEAYNGRTLHFWFPQHGKPPLHMYSIKFMWKL